MKLSLTRQVETFSLAVGLLDGCTGLALIVAPRLTVGLFGVSDPPSDTVFLRFVGVFVAAVGAAYLLPFLLDRGHRLGRLRTIFEITALLRTAVALFIGGSLLSGGLSLPWITVMATDWLLAIAQLGWLRQLWRQR